MDADAAAAGCGSGGIELRYLWMQWTPASSEVSVPTPSPQHVPSRHRSLWVTIRVSSTATFDCSHGKLIAQTGCWGGLFLGM